MRRRSIGVLVAALLLLPACSASRPVLYPNGHLVAVGADAARVDTDDCLDRASHYVHTGDLAAGARQTAGGAVIGGAGGAAYGAAVGNTGERAAGGAAAGAAVGFTRWLLFRPRPPRIERTYAEICLRQLGYQPIGWQ